MKVQAEYGTFGTLRHGSQTGLLCISCMALTKQWRQNRRVLPLQTVDLFSFRFVFVPIHDHLHWSLAVICNLGSTARQGEFNAPFILHLDSLRGAQKSTATGSNVFVISVRC